MQSESPGRASSRHINARLLPVAVVLVLVLAGIGVDWWYRHTGTPEYSLSQLGAAVRDRNYGRASYFVDEERIADSISRSLTNVLVAKYTKAIQDDPLPLTQTRIDILHKVAPRFQDLALLGLQNGIRLLLSGNPLLTGTSHFSQLDVRNFSQLHVLRSEVSGDTADVVVAGLPQPNPFGLSEIHIRMARIPNSRQWRIEEIVDVQQVLARYFGTP